LSESIPGVTRQQVSSQYMAHSYVKLSTTFHKYDYVLSFEQKILRRFSRCAYVRMTSQVFLNEVKSLNIMIIIIRYRNYELES
jgi:hypothetical protein